MSMMISSFRRRAVGDGIVAPAVLGFRFARCQQAIDARLHVVLPEAGQAVREGEYTGDEKRAEAEQPELREGLRKAGLGEIDEYRAPHRAEDRHPAADRRV